MEPWCSTFLRETLLADLYSSDGVGTIVSVCGDRSVKLLQRRLGLMATTGDCMGDDLHRLLVSVSRIGCGKGCTALIPHANFELHQCCIPWHVLEVHQCYQWRPQRAY